MTHEDYVVAIDQSIDKYGWHAVGIIGTDHSPSWTYSIGFERLGHPEVLIVGLDMRVSHGVLWQIHHLIKDDNKLFVPPMQVEGLIAGGYKLAFIDIPDVSEGDWFNMAAEYHNGYDFTAVQAVWPDMQSNFPWDPDYDVRYHQCLVGER